MNTIGVIANLDKSGTRELLPRLSAKAEAAGLDLLYDISCAPAMDGTPCTPDAELFERSEAVLTLGGDGTLLSAVRRMGAHPVPLLGVNFGKLGFLTSITEDEVDQALEGLASGKLLHSRRRLLDCEIDRREQTVRARALNDVVLSWGKSSHIAHLRVFVDDEPVTTYTCDGLILSTPTGSTGHSLSAGGPILTPDSDSLVLSPICPHSMTVRPVVLPASARVRVCLDTDSKALVLACDGQPMGELAPGDGVTAQLSDLSIELLQLPDYQYWEVLETKLHWRGSNVD